MPAKEKIEIKAYAGCAGYTAISVIFFIIIAVIIGYGSQTGIPYFGGDIFAAVFFLFGMISFLGGALFLYRTANGDKSWYFRIPLIGSIAVVALSSFLSPALQVKEVLLLYPLLALFNAYIGWFAFILLAPFSALFFHSLKVLKKGTVGVHVLVSLGASFFSGLMLLGLQKGDTILFPHPTGIAWLYLIIGLPAIGFMFLVTSGRIRDAPG